MALGHPIGCTGARITVTLLDELRNRGGGVGAAALCGGGGQGDALIVRGGLTAATPVALVERLLRRRPPGPGAAADARRGRVGGAPARGHGRCFTPTLADAISSA